MGVYIKAGFGLLAAVLYTFGAFDMVDGALNTASFAPGDPSVYLVTACGAAITTFVATQLGIAIASGTSNGNGNGFVARTNSYSGNSTGHVTAGVLIVDLLVLTIFGLLFVWLWVSPGNIAVPDGSKALTSAPEYVTVQAKAFVALVLAGAAGVGVAATK